MMFIFMFFLDHSITYKATLLTVFVSVYFAHVVTEIAIRAFVSFRKYFCLKNKTKMRVKFYLHS